MPGASCSPGCSRTAPSADALLGRANGLDRHGEPRDPVQRIVVFGSFARDRGRPGP